MAVARSPWAFVALLFLIVGVQSARAARAMRGEQIARDNLAAAYDTTRSYLSDSLQASTRLALQSDAVHDSLSDLLRTALAGRNATGAALQILQIRFDSVRSVEQEPVFDTVFVQRGDTVRVVSFTHDGPPIEGSQTVRIAGSVTLDSRLTVSPFSITTGLGCDGPTPVFLWDHPSWVSADFIRGAVSPDVCRVPSPSPLLSISTGKSLWLAAGIIIGVFAGGGVR